MLRQAMVGGCSLFANVELREIYGQPLYIIVSYLVSV